MHYDVDKIQDDIWVMGMIKNRKARVDESFDSTIFLSLLAVYHDDDSILLWTFSSFFLLHFTVTRC